MRHLKLILATAVVALIVPPSTALADDFYASTSGEITTAVNAANDSPQPSTVHIAAGTYAIDHSTFPLLGTGPRLDIVGAGADQTMFTGDAGGSGTIELVLPTMDRELRGFRLHTTANANHMSSLIQTRGTLRDFRIDLGGWDSTGNVALRMGSGTSVSRGQIYTTDAKTAISATAGSISIAEVMVASAGSGAGLSVSGSANVTVSRSTFKAFDAGVLQQSGTLNLTDSLIDMDVTDGARGLQIRDQQSGVDNSIIFNASRVTVVGNATSQVGLLTGTGNVADAGDVIVWTLHDALIYSPQPSFAPVVCSGAQSTGTLGRLAAASGPTITAGCSADLGSNYFRQLSDSPFNDFAGKDFRPKWNSPAIDAGETSAVAGSLDRAGSTRVVDGDGDGNALVDIGAYEYQRSAPVVSLTPSKSDPEVGESTTFTADASDADGEGLSYSWSVDGVASPETGATLTTSFATDGTHTVTVTTRDFAGVVSAAVSSVGVKAKPGGAAASAYARVTGKPKRAFIRGRKGFTAGANKKKTNFAILLRDTSKTRFTLGKVGTNKKVKKLKGSQTLKVKSGTNRFAFGGRWGGKKLKAGSYRVTITPIRADGVAGKSVSLTIKLR